MQAEDDDHEVEVHFSVPFTMVPVPVLDDEKLSGIDKIVFVMLCRFSNNQTGKCRPRMSTIGKLAGIHRNTVGRAIAALESRGYVKKDARTAANGRKVANIYTILARSHATVECMDHATLEGNRTILPEEELEGGEGGRQLVATPTPPSAPPSPAELDAIFPDFRDDTTDDDIHQENTLEAEADTPQVPDADDLIDGLRALARDAGVPLTFTRSQEWVEKTRQLEDDGASVYSIRRAFAWMLAHDLGPRHDGKWFWDRFSRYTRESYDSDAPGEREAVDLLPIGNTPAPKPALTVPCGICGYPAPMYGSGERADCGECHAVGTRLAGTWGWEAWKPIPEEFLQKMNSIFTRKVPVGVST